MKRFQPVAFTHPTLGELRGQIVKVNKISVRVRVEWTEYLVHKDAIYFLNSKGRFVSDDPDTENPYVRKRNLKIGFFGL